MRLVMVRHGDAYAGLHGTIAGPRGCAGLTPLGRRQAEALRDRLAVNPPLKADVLIASVLPRAIETTQIIASGLGFETFGQDCDLCEVHVGEADTLDWSEYTKVYGTIDMEAQPDRIFAPGGDSWSSFHERVAQMLQRLARDHPEETVYAVCHAGVIMASIRAVFDVPHPGTGAQLRPSNTGLTEWHHDPETGRWTLHSFNDASHLMGMAETSA